MLMWILNLDFAGGLAEEAVDLRRAKRHEYASGGQRIMVDTRRRRIG